MNDCGINGWRNDGVGLKGHRDYEDSKYYTTKIKGTNKYKVEQIKRLFLKS